MKSLLMLLLLFASCIKEKDDLILSQSNVIIPSNLIQNSGFELNGSASFNYWNYPFGSCCTDTFSTDVPANGGAYSLRLQPLWYPAEGAADTYITGIVGSASFHLMFDARCINVPQATAYAAVYIKGSAVTSSPALTFSDTSWQHYQLTATVLNITPLDTVSVRISAGSTEAASWEVLFDNVQLFKLPH